MRIRSNASRRPLGALLAPPQELELHLLVGDLGGCQPLQRVVAAGRFGQVGAGALAQRFELALLLLQPLGDLGAGLSHLGDLRLERALLLSLGNDSADGEARQILLLTIERQEARDTYERGLKIFPGNTELTSKSNELTP